MSEAAVKKIATPEISGPSLAMPSGVLYVQPIACSDLTAIHLGSFGITESAHLSDCSLGEGLPKYSDTALKLPKQSPAGRVAIADVDHVQKFSWHITPIIIAASPAIIHKLFRNT
jgi:hypothetical protein